MANLFEFLNEAARCKEIEARDDADWLASIAEKVATERNEELREWLSPKTEESSMEAV